MFEHIFEEHLALTRRAIRPFGRDTSDELVEISSRANIRSECKIVSRLKQPCTYKVLSSQTSVFVGSR